uniref:Uncharacterized protein n=1 Tax=Tetranychus urticae TaxID=32264 RepID=T1KS96_TETUR
MILKQLDSTELLVSVSSDCDFFCKSSRSCLRSSLVCNGFPNCPLTTTPDGSPVPAEDESEDLCSKPSLLYSLVSNRFVLIGLSLLILIVLLLLTITITRRIMVKYRRKNDSF